MATKHAFALGKSHKLCSKVAIERLFANQGQSAISYPLRAVWTENSSHCGAKFLISIPKKRLRHAVDRVLMRRRVREAYRLRRGQFLTDALPSGIDLAFVYVSDQIEDYGRVDKAMTKLLAKIFAKAGSATLADF